MNTRLIASMGLVTFVLASTIALLVADRHFGSQPPDTTTLRDWCVELATTSKYPTLFVEAAAV